MIEGEDITPNAETAQPAEGQENKSGVQKRIDELVGQLHQYKQELATQAGKYEALLSMQIQQQNQPKETPKTSDPFEGLDYTNPEAVARALSAKLASIEERTQRTLQQAISGITTQVRGTALQQMARQLNLTPEAEELAARTLAGATSKGLPMTEEDAIDWATGRLQRQGKAAYNKPRDNRGQFVPANLPQGGAATVQTNQHKPKPQPPANYNQLNYQEQAAWLDANTPDEPC